MMSKTQSPFDHRLFDRKSSLFKKLHFAMLCGIASVAVCLYLIFFSFPAESSGFEYLGLFVFFALPFYAFAQLLWTIKRVYFSDEMLTIPLLDSLEANTSSTIKFNLLCLAILGLVFIIEFAAT